MDFRPPPYVATGDRQVRVEGFGELSGEGATPVVDSRTVGSDLWLQLIWPLRHSPDDGGAGDAAVFVARFPNVDEVSAHACSGVLVLGRLRSSTEPWSSITIDFEQAPFRHGRLAAVEAAPATIAARVSLLTADIETRSPYADECDSFAAVAGRLEPVFVPEMLFDRTEALDADDLEAVERDCSQTGCYAPDMSRCGQLDRPVCRVCHDDVCLHPGFQSDCGH